MYYLWINVACGYDFCIVHNYWQLEGYFSDSGCFIAFHYEHCGLLHSASLENNTKGHAHCSYRGKDWAKIEPGVVTSQYVSNSGYLSSECKLICVPLDIFLKKLC